MAEWLKTPPGRYVLEWEQGYMDIAVADVFGFHALQLGLPELDALRANRMPHRWIAVEAMVPPGEQPPVPKASGAADEAEVESEAEAETEAPAVEPKRPPTAIALRCDFDALPFDSSSLDLVVLPHVLERARDPHLALREVERVLMPEGRVVVVGFNPASLWGLRQRMGSLRGGDRPLFISDAGGLIGYRRLRDWLRLLSFEVEAGRFGCYRPPMATDRWLQRFDWVESVGERWWPVFGAVYFVVAVKRVRGMRLVGMVKKPQAVRATAPAPVVAVHHHDKGGKGRSA